MFNVKAIVMNLGPPCCVVHIGYMWAYVEEVHRERECGKDGVKKEMGVLEETSLENLT